jgi:hypothetical protein
MKRDDNSPLSRRNVSTVDKETLDVASVTGQYGVFRYIVCIERQTNSLKEICLSDRSER